MRVAADSVPLAADLGFSFADAFAIAVAFVGVAVFAAIGALSHEHERAFSASIFYLGFGLIAAAGIHFLGIRWLDPFADSDALRARDASSRWSSRCSRPG